METLNAIACGMLFIVCAWAILHQQFKDGVLMKAALIMLAFSSLGQLFNYITPHYDNPPREILTNVAATLLVVSMVWRRAYRAVWNHGVTA